MFDFSHLNLTQPDRPRGKIDYTPGEPRKRNRSRPELVITENPDGTLGMAFIYNPPKPLEKPSLELLERFGWKA